MDDQAAGDSASSPEPPHEPAHQERITIQDAINVFLTNREGAEIASPRNRS